MLGDREIEALLRGHRVRPKEDRTSDAELATKVRRLLRFRRLRRRALTGGAAAVLLFGIVSFFTMEKTIPTEPGNMVVRIATPLGPENQPKQVEANDITPPPSPSSDRLRFEKQLTKTLLVHAAIEKSAFIILHRATMDPENANEIYRTVIELFPNTRASEDARKHLAAKNTLIGES